ncbi:hypothetical protein [Mesorhizobium sp. M0118]|uniref:hypothetical protein n=1 Tax=Mesorhizobium sp. M0118 TaxID=2956884 RepID=UPI00333A54CF
MAGAGGLVKFVAHHRMPADVSATLKSRRGLLRSDGPQAPSTVRRRLSNWPTLTIWRGMVAKFNAPGCGTTFLPLTICAAVSPRRI